MFCFSIFPSLSANLNPVSACVEEEKVSWDYTSQCKYLLRTVQAGIRQFVVGGFVREAVLVT